MSPHVWGRLFSLSFFYLGSTDENCFYLNTGACHGRWPNLPTINDTALSWNQRFHRRTFYYIYTLGPIVHSLGGSESNKRNQFLKRRKVTRNRASLESQGFNLLYQGTRTHDNEFIGLSRINKQQGLVVFIALNLLGSKPGSNSITDRSLTVLTF